MKMKNLFVLLTVLVLIACGEDQSAAPVYEPTKVDTLVISNTDTIFVSELDTIWVSNTDTLKVSLTDTVYVDKTDTVTVKDIIELIDTVSITDTMTIIDTVINDTVSVLVTDTVKVTDTVSIVDTVKVIDTVFVSSSSSEASSSSEESSSSIEEISSSSEESSSSAGSILDSITTFKVDGKVYTLYSPTVYFQEEDPEIFHYSKWANVCDHIGGIPVNEREEIVKIKDQAFSLVGDSTTFIGIRHPSRREYNMIVSTDSSFIYVKDVGMLPTYDVDIRASGIQLIGFSKSKLQSYGVFHACRFDD